MLKSEITSDQQLRQAAVYLAHLVHADDPTQNGDATQNYTFAEEMLNRTLRRFDTFLIIVDMRGHCFRHAFVKMEGWRYGSFPSSM